MGREAAKIPPGWAVRRLVKQTLTPSVVGGRAELSLSHVECQARARQTTLVLPCPSPRRLPKSRGNNPALTPVRSPGASPSCGAPRVLAYSPSVNYCPICWSTQAHHGPTLFRACCGTCF